ncbi:MAG: TIGR03564 family F420-dependent LLM class oxidoreductase [Gammaproteobacteria bacterium]|nr:TIGR03564 family F420-dependent LLM class oxidoreductase [Gammaproteobacteria bacterium]
MKFGLMSGAGMTGITVDSIVALARRAEAAGFATLWMAHIRTIDAISALGVAGRDTTRIELGTAVTPTYPRHPMAMAQQALTTAQMSGNRFVLGIGLSHKLVIEDMLGLSYAQPARHMREYLKVLRPLLRGEVVNFDGEEFRIANLQIEVPGVPDVPVVVAALGEHMLRLTGRLADGTSTWMTGPKTIAEHIVPHLARGASDAGRPAPRVIGGYPIVLTTAVDAARETIGKTLAIYGQLPSYRAMLDREGYRGPADAALVGDEATLRAEFARRRDAGVTDFNAAIADVEPGAFDRTFEFLAAVQGEFA